MKRTALALTIISMLLFTTVAGIAIGASTVGDVWEVKASMPTSRGFLGVTSANGKIYAIGGNGPNKKNEEYDPKANNWTAKASMPVEEQSFALAVVEDKIYCIGGMPTGAEGRNQVYNSGNNSWENKAPMPVARTILQANVVEGKIYLIGGYNPDRPYNTGYELVKTTYVYDTASDTWTTKSPMPNMVPVVSAAIDNKIYCINSNITQIYNTKTDKWSTAAPPPKGLNGEGTQAITIAATTGTVAPKLIYVYDGSYLQAYNPANNSWTIGANPPVNRQYGAMTVLNDTIYLIGGFDDHVNNIPGFYYFYGDNDQYIPFGYGTVPPASTTDSEPFPTTSLAVAFVASIAIVTVGTLVYWKKQKQSQ